jgi:hypothetical protein
VCVCALVDHRRKDVVAAVGGGCSGYMCKDAGAPPEKRHARSEDGEAREDETRSKRD